MNRKYFELDKNYILAEAQEQSQEKLLSEMVTLVKRMYLSRCNPLGLIDDAILRIRNTDSYDLSIFDSFYEKMSAIYRFHHGSNQLEFVFDGRSQEQRYSDDWNKQFRKWMAAFCQEKSFLKLILSLTVFIKKTQHMEFAESRLTALVHGFFEVRIYKRKGITPMKVA